MSDGNDHDHRGEYAESHHDHRGKYAERYHDHDDNVREIGALRARVRQLEDDVRTLNGRIAGLARIVRQLADQHV